ncbi:MAG: Hdr-like menaquinol oxidoreductase cytochrome c subunit [Magnetococcales bacterium]|nr:Hdr-like menaquinol oxidoreductase cytochrome c subunit [Magnetococcales bacterium]
MKSPTSMAGRMSRASFLLLVLFAAWIAAPFAVWADPPTPEKAVRGPCVRDAEWMRRNHMDFLKHKRDETVREGITVKSESFLSCAGCHPSRERFCDRCHAYAAVAPNCFECHQYPK